jgi:hypothetical protein
MSEKQPSPDNPKQESLSHSSWDLVHSKHLEDVKRGIAMLQCKPLLYFSHLRKI